MTKVLGPGSSESVIPACPESCCLIAPDKKAGPEIKLFTIIYLCIFVAEYVILSLQ